MWGCAGEEAVQYNTARTLRHLALGSQPAHKTAALPAIVPLTQALQVSPCCHCHQVAHQKPLPSFTSRLAALFANDVHFSPALQTHCMDMGAANNACCPT